MRNQFKFFLFTLLLSIFSISYAVTQDASNQNVPNPNINDPKHGAIVVLKVSPTFVIRLKSNPTTGYTWFVNKIDRRLIKPVSHQYHPPAQQIPGAGGYEEWVFMAKPEAFARMAPTHISFIYVRPWEKKAVQTVVFKIVPKNE